MHIVGVGGKRVDEITRGRLFPDFKHSESMKPLTLKHLRSRGDRCLALTIQSRPMMTGNASSPPTEHFKSRQCYHDISLVTDRI
jgi:hypothetical protein